MSATAPDELPPVDGRRARAERNREAVVEAILDLLREGVEDPGVNEIAERSGVSVRSVFRHFDDLESLHTTAIEVHLRQVGRLFQFQAPDSPTSERVDALVDHRALLYEDIAPIRRVAARLRRTSPQINATLTDARRFLRSQLEASFEPELAKRKGAKQDDLLDAIELVSGWLAWDSLRTEHGLSVARAKRVMSLNLHGLLG